MELLALVLGTGSRSSGAVELARELLERFPSLAELADLDAAQLRGLRGLGPARATALVAAFELGRRATRRSADGVAAVESPEEAADLLAPALDGLKQESVVALFLGARHQPLAVRTIALGSLNAAGVQPREVFRGAIAVGAAALILAHNHPSGDPEPSEDDVRLTRRLVRCGETLGIEVLDHLVMASGHWVSLRERRVL